MQGVDTEYKPALIKDGTNPHTLRAIGCWLAIFVPFAALAGYALWTFPYYSPRDPDLLYRWITQRWVQVFFVVVFLTGWIEVQDFRSNGNMMGRIYRESTASAVYIVGTSLCIVLAAIGG